MCVLAAAVLHGKRVLVPCRPPLTAFTSPCATPPFTPPCPQLFVKEEEGCRRQEGETKQKKCCQDKEERGVWDWFCDKVRGGGKRGVHRGRDAQGFRPALHAWPAGGHTAPPAPLTRLAPPPLPLPPRPPPQMQKGDASCEAAGGANAQNRCCANKITDKTVQDDEFCSKVGRHTCFKLWLDGGGEAWGGRGWAASRVGWLQRGRLICSTLALPSRLCLSLPC